MAVPSRNGWRSPEDCTHSETVQYEVRNQLGMTLQIDQCVHCERTVTDSHERERMRLFGSSGDGDGGSR